MSGGYRRYIPIISLAGEIILLALFFIIGYLLRFHKGVIGAEYILFFSYLFVAWTMSHFLSGSHRIHAHLHRNRILNSTFRSMIFFFFFYMMYFQVAPLGYYPKPWLRVIFPVFSLLVLSWRYLLHMALLYYRQKGFNFRKAILVGNSPSMAQLQQHLQSDRWHGLRLVGNISVDADNSPSTLGKWDDLPQILEKNKIDEVFVSLYQIREVQRKQLAGWLNEYPAQLHLVPELHAFSYQTLSMDQVGGIPVISTHPSPLNLWYNQLLKRCFDILFSLLVIITLLSWITPILWIIDMLGARQGVFFVQRRTSILYKDFPILKYRSMVQNHEADLRQATRNDPRITPLGRFLRSSNIDELPQFINVFLGQMSVVGPRPHMLQHTLEYKKIVDTYLLRHTVKPGVTGLAQSRGLRGEVHTAQDIKRRVETDIEYIRQWSIWMDLQIIWKTILLSLKVTRG